MIKEPTEEKYRLPRKFTTEWLEALRSGKYEQGNSVLKSLGDNPTYCCLGVAAEINGCVIKEYDGYGDLTESSWLEIGSLGEDVYKIPQVLWGYEELPRKLADMNDGTNSTTGLSFSEIADWIENNVELYDEEDSNH